MLLIENIVNYYTVESKADVELIRNLSPETVLTKMAETFKNFLDIETVSESWGAELMKNKQNILDLQTKLESYVSQVT